MDSLGAITGWLALAVIAIAALLPLVTRVSLGRRAAPDSRPTRIHVVAGIAAAAFSLVHTLAAIPALGEPVAIEAGNLALAAGALAFFVIVAHVGIGLQLRDVKLRDRVKKRRLHVITASLIVLVVGVHATLVFRAARSLH
jgi:formate-dependent nitrite reductase membrane component NrfD